jgi:hypothetical protein
MGGERRKLWRSRSLGLGRIWASRACVDDRAAGFRDEGDCGRLWEHRARARGSEIMSSSATSLRAEVRDERCIRRHFANNANKEKVERSARWWIASSGGPRAIGGFLGRQSAEQQNSLETAWAVSGAICNISSCDISGKDGTQVEEGCGRNPIAWRHDRDEGAVEFLRYGVRGGANYQGRPTDSIHAEEGIRAIDSKAPRVSSPADGLVKLCADCLNRYLADRDDLTRIEARSGGERSGRPGGISGCTAPLRERRNVSSERSVPQFPSRGVASVAGLIDRPNCGRPLAWTARLLSPAPAGRWRDVRDLRRPLGEREGTLEDPFGPNVKSLVPPAAFGTSTVLAPVHSSAGVAQRVAPDSCSGELRFSRIQWAIRHSISASIHSSTTWRSSFRKLAARFMRESSNDSRDVLENVTRISSDGWTESNAKPPRNRPPKGEREAIGGRVSLKERTSMVPG